MFKKSFFVLLILSLSSPIVQAAQSLTSQKNVQQFITMMEKKHGFKKQDLVELFKEVQIQPAIIQSMDAPYEKKDWDTYREIFLTQQRLQAGLEFWQANQKSLEQAEQTYHVPASIIVAILGVETLYGEKQGNYRVMDALSTLAFNYPKRSPYFTRELTEFLLLCREHHTNPMQYIGSYAGAFGKPQFMPSSYRSYAVDFKKNSNIDLVHDNQAVVASIANYFHRHGWIMNQGVVQPAKITGQGITHFNTQLKQAEYNTKQLVKSGIQPMTAATNQPPKAGVIELSTKSGPEYWLAYHNFYVITRYNSSPQYALVVYLLAQQLQKERLAALSHHAFAYS